MKKKPKRSKEPPQGKKVRPSSVENDFTNFTPVWQVSQLTYDGEWGWKNATKDELLSDIIPSLQNYETMTWFDIQQAGSHNVGVPQICSVAQKKLNEIQNEDIDEIFSLRLSGKKRIWGILDRNILKIIWWDPKHQVCPSNKKHT